MTSWNYRFVSVQHPGEDEPLIGLYEVYYDDEGNPTSRTVELATIVGDTKMEAWNAVSLAAAAVGKPVLQDSLFDPPPRDVCPVCGGTPDSETPCLRPEAHAVEAGLQS